jgi:hypothetical protein
MWLPFAGLIDATAGQDAREKRKKCAAASRRKYSDRRGGHAARAAALAGCGKGNDAGQLDDKERALRRRQALEWLRQDLAACSEMADNRDTQTRALLRERLRNWQGDYDLAGVRARDGLARLPDAEREQWERLWFDVDALLRQVSGPD